ncbi:hypothetical protein OG599_08945 [Streptomyces sp. NBC_01335]|uniref:hypothetical protein n=1 Tax=Streptomyces sp. NBC_01335 TaxID=2903828 RepID=UPI002E155D4C|nr:hypothetical protein OG599_08945 [Streptomyces sp. NBC_01335]
MTTERSYEARRELADLLTNAARDVAGILAAEYPTAAGCSYLHPVLGPLSAGPRVVTDMAARFEAVVAGKPLPTTPTGLLVLASYASALGWLSESLAELTTSVDQIGTRVGTPANPPDPDPVDTPTGFGAEELAEVQLAAEAAGLAPGDYVEVLSQSLLAASRITDACMEIAAGLLDDATCVLDESMDPVSIGDGPNSLPTLVRSLLARLGAAE